MPNEVEASPSKTLDCELCVIGAGYAALNGLNVAAKYLKKGDRVVMIDKNASWGGQWLHQYDFVRLHQPYRMFTAGDQTWKLAREPEYLATRREVLEHLSSVPGVSAGHLDVVPIFGHAYRGHRIHEGRAELEVLPTAAASGSRAPVRIRARRLLKAIGTDIEMLPPFGLSSSRVRSVGISDPMLMTPEFLESDAPVYIIGSGKSAMDCVRHIKLQSRNPKRPVHVLAGSGMWFFVRDSLYPLGARRYAQGELTADVFLQIAQLFDGQNEAEVMRAFEQRRLVTNVFGFAGNCRLGLLSYSEREEILRGVGDVYRGHLLDVEGNRMILRDGNGEREVQVADGSWFINCTTHLRAAPHEPLLQDSGIVCAPQFAFGFSGTSAYYVTHLWFCNELAPIAPEMFRGRLDVEPKLRFVPHMSLMVMANMALAVPRLPFSVPAKFQGDFNKWYPTVRQLPTLARITASRARVLRKAERLLRIRFSDSPDVPARLEESILASAAQ